MPDLESGNIKVKYTCYEKEYCTERISVIEVQYTVSGYRQYKDLCKATWVSDNYISVKFSNKNIGSAENPGISI